MTKLEIQAIQCLPEQFVRDGTAVATATNANGHKWVVVINPMFAPWTYSESKKTWEPMMFTVAD